MGDFSAIGFSADNGNDAERGTNPRFRGKVTWQFQLVVCELWRVNTARLQSKVLTIITACVSAQAEHIRVIVEVRFAVLFDRKTRL